MNLLQQKKFLPWVIFILVLGIAPIFADRYIIHILCSCLVWSIIASNWNLVLGFGGIFSLAPLAFWVGGAYMSAMLSKHLGLLPWLAMPIAGLGMALVGFLLGLPCLRIKGVHTALFTLIFFECLSPLITWGRKWGTGGSSGLAGIPRLQIGEFSFDTTFYYYTAFILFLIIIYLLHKIINSSIGKAFIALRDAPLRANSLGVDEYRYSLLIFTISSFFLGLTGGFYAHWMGSLSVHLLGLSLFLMVLLMVEGGGMGRLSGGIVGAFSVTILSEILRPLEKWRLVIFGAMMIIIIVLAPEGMVRIGDVFGEFLKDFFKPGRKGGRDQEEREGSMNQSQTLKPGG